MHPDWALKFKKPGTELRNINGHYYLYEVTSVYDKKLKRPKKKTGPLLGSITEDKGFIPSPKRLLIEKNTIKPSDISVKEYGVTAFLSIFNQQIQKALDKFFPDFSKQIVYMAYCRLLHSSPIKNFPFHLSKSYLTLNDNTNFTDKYFSNILNSLGKMRPSITDFMKSFIKPNDYLIVDMTNIFSESNNLRYTEEGYNNKHIFNKQINLLYIYSASLCQPTFYQLYPGNIREIKSFKLCLEESGINNAVIIADKGFYSTNNVNLLEKEQLCYILPLKRNNLLINYELLKGDKLPYFKYNNRYIWYNQIQINHKQILFLYRDESLQLQEKTDYLDRIDVLPEYYNIEIFREKVERFGTLAILTNLKEKDAQQIYGLYKSRNSIELMFDTMKNIVELDRTYMQNDDTLQGWMFINHIAVQWYYIIYKLLLENNLLSKYSVKDLLMHLNGIKKVRINDTWITEPMLKSTEKLLNKLNIHIT